MNYLLLLLIVVLIRDLLPCLTFHAQRVVKRAAACTILREGDYIDREIVKGQRILEKNQAKKETKSKMKIARAAAINSKEVDLEKVPIPGKNFAQKSIMGQNVITCREFSIDGQRKFEFIGGFKDVVSAPIFGVPEVCFIGRSNVGKSSLLNCLTGLNKKVAVESKTPGRTQCINMFKCADKIGDLCVFVDLPGYGFAKMSKVQQDETARFLKSYLEDRGPLKLAVLLIDVRREVQEADLGTKCFKTIMTILLY